MLLQEEKYHQDHRLIADVFEHLRSKATARSQSLLSKSRELRHARSRLARSSLLILTAVYCSCSAARRDLRLPRSSSHAAYSLLERCVHHNYAG